MRLDYFSWTIGVLAKFDASHVLQFSNWRQRRHATVFSVVIMDDGVDIQLRKLRLSRRFIVNITQPPGDLAFDPGPNELGMSGSGTDTYTDTGVFSLGVDSECNWSITVKSSGGPAPAPTPAPVAPTAVGVASTPNGGGYWIAYSNGAVSPRGDAGNYGGVSNLTLNAPINHIEP